MKHRILSLTLAILLLITIFSGCSVARKMDAAEDRLEHKLDTIEDSVEHKFEQSVSHSVTPAPDTKIYNSPTPDQLTDAQAMEIALAHSGYTADQVQYLRTDFEIDDRIPQYDVQFYVEHMEYEYEIHAETGEILSYDRDR